MATRPLIRALAIFGSIAMFLAAVVGLVASGGKPIVVNPFAHYGLLAGFALIFAAKFA